MAPITRRSLSSKAGLIFPAARIHRKLKSLPQQVKRVSKGAAVYLTGVVEYLMAEIIELSGNACRDNRLTRISPRHVKLAIGLDQELNKLMKNVVIPGGGVIPNIPLTPLVVPKPPRITPAPAIGGAKPSGRAAKKATPAPVKPTLTKLLSGTKKSKNITVLSERALPSGQKLTVVQADITDVVVDAIVHPTNNSFYLGGEVGNAISNRGGQKVRDIVKQLHLTNGNLAVGGVSVSDASDTMFCNKIIHVYSPSWDFTQQVQRINDLSKVVNNILTLADTNKLKTVALPSISSGGNGFPKQVAAQTILRAINSYFKGLDAANKPSVEQVFFVLYDKESVDIYTSELGKLDINSA